MKYIAGGKIIMPDGIVTGRALAYNEKIAGLTDDIPSGAEVIDAEGRFVSPGFIDIHVHGYMGEDVSDGKAEGLKVIAGGIIENGVTSFLPTTMTVSEGEINAAFDSVRSVKEKSRSWKGAEILGVHAEGPFINPSKKGAQAAENIKKPNAAFIMKNADIIKSLTMAPETDDDHACIKHLAAKTDILLSMGHTDATFEEAMSAVEDGIGHATHLFNAMSALAHRNPGVVGAVLASDISCEIIADTFHIHPGLFSIVAGLKQKKLVLVTDCTRAGGMPDGEYSLGGQPIFLKGIECRLADGTIAGSVLRLNKAVDNMLKHTELPYEAVIDMVTINAARIIHEDGRLGSLGAGKDADIVIFDDEINIYRTIKGGRTVYTV
ncbi:MAG: N-acetylglucosamine-6-phosphate deacetylase [Eubacteriales bacterium]|jgi:N-acetylglucosamine-6-phosphate deacetylase|nr:N-acetylglucosamine-6-phosphate deacetylase [Eubacteriales bacterium]